MELQRKHNNKIDYISRDYFKNFKSIYPNIKLTQELHTKIITVFFSIAVKRIIHDMYKFHFPGLGYFYLTKNKNQVRVTEEGVVKLTTGINWKETIKVREKTGDNTKKVLYLNEHTNGYVYGIYWDKRNAAFINKRFYSFLPTRIIKRSIASTIQENIKPLNAYAR